LIGTVAMALRGKKINEWEVTLDNLERFDREGLLLDIIYSALELSYNCLESDELKSLFLLIGSFGLDYIHTDFFHVIGD